MVLDRSSERILLRHSNKVLACPICDSVVSFKQKVGTNDNDEPIYKFRCYICPNQPLIDPIERNSLLNYVVKGRNSVHSERDLPTYGELLMEIEKLEIKNSDILLRDRAFLSLLYISGCRVSEIIGKKGSMKYDFNNVCEPLRKKDFVFYTENDGSKWLEIRNVPILKSRSRNYKKKTIPIYLDAEHEIVQYLKDYLETIQLDDYLFTFKRRHALNIVKKIWKDKYCHFFRHMRITHLLGLGIPIDRVVDYIGWAKFESIQPYRHLSVSQLKRDIKANSRRYD